MAEIIEKFKEKILYDRRSFIARKWSNKELKKFAHLFRGKIINVSAWRDEDKEGKKYKDYFINASEYWISNYDKDKRGFQGNIENEIYLDLTQDLSEDLKEKFDVVFNHTTLEHIFEVFKAFENLCKMSKDIVIVVVPFLQQQHAEYGDYWRFTPLTLKKLFEKNNMRMIYINFNDNDKAAIYLFAIGSKHPEKWKKIIEHPDNKLEIIDEYYVGENFIKNSWIFNLKLKISKTLHKISSI